MAQTHAGLLELSGGYTWSCGGMDSMKNFFDRKDVQAAMHLQKPGQSQFDYKSSGPASVTLYPELVTKLRVLIYNGDSDACGLLVVSACYHPTTAVATSLPVAACSTVLECPPVVR